MALDPTQLGQLIIDENPYTTSSSSPILSDVIEVQGEPGTWPFKGSPHHIKKAIRITYTYTHNGHTVRDYILIGYEGGGAY